MSGDTNSLLQRPVSPRSDLPRSDLLRSGEQFGSARAQLARTELRFATLDSTFCDRLITLEQRCYSHPWSPELIRGEFEKPISLRYGLISDDEIFAYCLNYLVADELHVLNLAVAPEARGLGLGKHLLSRVLELGLERGARFATLEVRPSNYIAKRLYSSLGFEVVGLRKNYYRDNYENALVLECKLGALKLRSRSLISPTTRALER